MQAGLVRILEAIYEGDFIDDSYGFRPGRGCHDALRALSFEVEGGKVHYIVEADIKGFFDNVQHGWMMEFRGHRIADKRVLRYVKRFLIAGVVEDGAVVATEMGTPQGGIISPVLANIYLHYVLDPVVYTGVRQDLRRSCEAQPVCRRFRCLLSAQD